MTKLSIRDMDLAGKRVFIRVDFNVPMNSAGEVTEDTRIRASLPSIKYAMDAGARLVLASHLGRPKGKPDPRYSLTPVRARLSALLGKQVGFASETIGTETEAMTGSLAGGEVLLLENLRFHVGEEKNDPGFARSLANLADLYVDDAFGASHRAHASIEGITHFIKQSGAGLLMEKELQYLGKAIQNPDRPFVVIIGGAKVSDKISVIENLLKSANSILIGGAMAYTFLMSEGLETGRSLVEPDRLEMARDLMRRAKEKGVAFELPSDHLVVDKAAWDADRGSAQPHECRVNETRATEAGLDIGPKTTEKFRQIIAAAKTIVWNGPMGVFEQPPFDRGTRAIAEAVAASGGTTIVGGGDSVAAVMESGVADRITHISTGGGASLEFLAGETLPGVAALTDV